MSINGSAVVMVLEPKTRRAPDVAIDDNGGTACPDCAQRPSRHEQVDHSGAIGPRTAYLRIDTIEQALVESGELAAPPAAAGYVTGYALAGGPAQGRRHGGGRMRASGRAPIASRE